MVLSLIHLCLLSIRDGLERGRRIPVHELPRKWHQIILNFVLQHGTILRPVCLDILSSIDFLRQFTFLNTMSGRVTDQTYLDRSADSVRQIINLGNIDYRFLHQLALNLYVGGSGNDRGDQSGKHVISVENFRGLAKLMGRCSNLKTLHFQFILTGDLADTPANTNPNPIVRFLPLASAPSSSSWKPLDDGGFLNAVTTYRSCVSILENLINFSLVTSDSGTRRPNMPPLITSHQPLIRFRSLRSLKLIGGTAYFDAWFKFLQSISGTLEILHVENVEFHWGRERNACVLPFRMSQLSILQAHGVLSYCDSIFIKNLQKCTQLEFISLTLSGLESDENLAALSQMEAVKDIRLNFRHGLFGDHADQVIGKLVKMFDHKISSFIFNGIRSPQLSMACEILMDGCQNLVAFRLDTSPGLIDTDQNFLAPLFQNRRRAWLLRDLELHGRLGQQVLSRLFKNCTQLESLSIWDCPQLTDAYLNRFGGKPHTIKLINCPKVTDEGLKSILISIGLGLLQFRFTCSERPIKVTEETMRLMGEICRNVEWFCCDRAICSESTLAKIKAKSFKYPIKAILI